MSALKNDPACEVNIIGQRLKAEMKKRGISSARLAIDAGVKTSFIYDVISGKSANPSTVKLARVADSLGISLKSLVETAEPGALSLPLGPHGEFVTVPRLSVDSARPQTTVVAAHEAEEPYAFRKSWVSSHLAVQPECLRLFVITGDSMEPALAHGDVVLVNIGSTHPSPPGIFIIYDGYGLAAKRLELLTHLPEPRIRVISDNPQYTSYEKSVEDISIIGRLVWFSRGI